MPKFRSVPLIESMGRLSKRAVMGYGLSLTVALVVADLLTGPELHFSIFHLVPVGAVAWFAGRRYAFILSLISASTWLFADIMKVPTFSSSAIVYWNTASRLGLLWIAVFGLTALRRAIETAETDFLTGALNKRAFQALLEAELYRARRFRRPITVCYLDVDNFKLVNDRFGHQTGDEVLRSTASVAREHLRMSDSVARVGGDEFALLLPEAGAAPAREVLEKVRGELLGAMREKGLPITFTIGAATFFNPPGTAAAVIEKADQLLYAAKTAGKDRIKHEVLSGEAALSVR